jgi:four helix bundle protein
MNMKRPVRSYKDLLVWQKSMDLAFEIYTKSDSGSFSKDYALKDQLRRSANSIPSNISEGWARFSRKEFAHFLSIANGSAAEVRTQLHLAQRYGHLPDEQAQKILTGYDEVSGMILSLRRKVMDQH